ncbi:MAG TPA: YkvA family protein [Aggregatilineales bacterium]|nr:YkvA family protein [Aggregatilineales bacterium]
MPTRIEGWRTWARRLKRKTLAVYLAYRDPRVPWVARLLAIAVLAYAFSPIDLIPDFIPVLGLVDDLVIVPAGLYLVIRMIPPEVMAEYEAKANQQFQKPQNWVMAGIIVGLWLLAAVLLLVLVARVIGRS